MSKEGDASPGENEQHSSSGGSGRSNFMERVVGARSGSSSDAPTDYREDIVRSIFGDVGTPVEDFSCAVESRILLHGRMYVTDTFVCFYSNLFGFEKIIKIPFCHMRCITKEKTALFIPNAIAIITSKKEYIFRSFWDREDAFKTLKQCQQEANNNGSAGHPHPDPAHALAPAPSMSPEREGPAPSPSQEGGGSADAGSSRENEEPEQSQTQRRRRRSGSGSGSGSGGSRGSDKDAEEKGSKSGGSRRRLLWSGKGDRKPSSSSSITAGMEREDHDHGLSVSAPSSNDASFSSHSHGGAAPAPAPGTAVAADTATTDTATTAADTPKGGLVPPSPDGKVQEETAEGRGQEEAVGAAVAGGGGGGGGGAGSTASDECLESEVDVLGVEGNPVTAVSLGATTGGGKMSSKAQDFNAALLALGEGWVVAADGEAEQPPPERPPATPGKGATVRISTEIPCELQEFFGLFVSNDAEKGIPAFHQSLGDSNVVATPWKVSGGALGMTREIRFVHPISAPIGPSSTRAVKLQRCRLYNEHGLILETSTHLEDIVMSDYFQIDDRCVVQPSRGDAGTVRVDVEVEIKFFKSTMFRKTIETKSLGETRQVWESFISMAKDAVQKRKPALPLRSPSGGEESEDEDRIRATRERLRERRKHRNRARAAPPNPQHEQESLPSRPRAKSAASTMSISPRAPNQEPPPRRRGHSGVGVDRKRGHSSAAAVVGSGGGGGGGGMHERRSSRGSSVGKAAGAAAGKVTAGGGGGGGGSVLVTPIPSVQKWLFSFAAVPWLLLAVVFLVEAVDYSRFSSETAGFLEAADAAMTVLGGKGEAEGAALRGELARGLTRIYARHRFLWPFSMF